MVRSRFKNIIFDFDSTLTLIEGLDSIAKKKGKLNQVRSITSAGMNGSLPFSQSIRKRLAIIKPTDEDFAWLAKEYQKTLLKDAKQVIRTIQKAGGNVFLVTGGPRLAIEPVAQMLSIKKQNIWASCLMKNGHDYLKADDNCLMTRDGGKVEVVKQISQIGKTIMIGDGMTDYEAGKWADLFIGFGGIVRREALKAVAKIYIEEPNLATVLKYL